MRTKAVTETTWSSTARIKVIKQCLQCFSTFPLHTMLQQGNTSPEDVIPPTKKYIKKLNLEFTLVNSGELFIWMKKSTDFSIENLPNNKQWNGSEAHILRQICICSRNNFIGVALQKAE